MFTNPVIYTGSFAYNSTGYDGVVCTDVCVPVVFLWEETGVPGGNPPV